MTQKVLLMKIIKIFWKIIYKAINLLQKANLNKNWSKWEKVENYELTAL